MLLLAACAPVAATPDITVVFDTPVPTASPTATQDTSAWIVTESPPLPTPTPYIYKMQDNDTLGGLADHFHIRLDAILAANPGINPNAIAVGAEIKIPSAPAGAIVPTATAVPVTVDQIACHAVQDGGQWCFVLLHNAAATMLENASVRVILFGSDGAVAGTKDATPLLDAIPPNSAFPIAVFFPAPLPSQTTPRVQILTAMAVAEDPARYLPAQLNETHYEFSRTALTATVEGSVALPATSRPAARVRVAAVAYAADGRLVGVYVWDAPDKLAAGASVPFSFIVSSVAGPMAAVDLFVEAAP